jgi:hypothetical protein
MDAATLIAGSGQQVSEQSNQQNLSYVTLLLN